MPVYALSKISSGQKDLVLGVGLSLVASHLDAIGGFKQKMVFPLTSHCAELVLEYFLSREIVLPKTPSNH